MRTVAITGASSGFGAALARAFGAAGYGLVLCGRDRDRLEETGGALQVPPDAMLSFDLRFWLRLRSESVFTQNLKDYDVGIIINNAAINPELTWCGPLATPSEVAEIIATNTSAAIQIAILAFEHLSSRGGGTIINVNSVAGLRGSAHEPVYAASKFGLRGFSESVKDAWFARGVRMIDLYSGAIATGMSAHRADVAELIDPDELAAFVVGLCATRSFVAREINVQKSPLGSN